VSAIETVQVFGKVEKREESKNIGGVFGREREKRKGKEKGISEDWGDGGSSEKAFQFVKGIDQISCQTKTVEEDESGSGS
jgi:hypothetical protein